MLLGSSVAQYNLLRQITRTESRVAQVMKVTVKCRPYPESHVFQPSVWCVLTFSEKYWKEKWLKPWDGKISWQKLLPRPRMELIQETFQSWKLRKHWHEFLLKDAFGAFISQYYAVYLRYKTAPSVLFSLAFRSQSRSVCSEVLNWAWLDWSITGFWEHRVKVTRKYSVFVKTRLGRSIQSGSYDWDEISHEIFKISKAAYLDPRANIRLMRS